MSTNTSIEWTEATWNPIRGCSIVSEGCRNCYAMRQAHRMDHPGGAYEGLTRMTASGPKWTGAVRTVPRLLDQPLRWKKPRRVFVNSMSDLFHEDVPFDFIEQVWDTMFDADRHTFQILTKRPERMVLFAEWMKARHRAIDYPNVWLGTSVEDQASADERVPHLLATPAAVRWLSCEPLLGPLNFRWTPWAHEATGETYMEYARRKGSVNEYESLRGIGWIVVGGESGPGARPFDVAWAREIVRQGAGAGVPVFVKQLGAKPVVTKATPCSAWPDSETEYAIQLHSHKGGDPDEWPADLRVREYPA